MPQTAGSADRAPAERAPEWATWLLHARTVRGKRPKDLVDEAAAMGEKLTAGQISNWENGRNPASPEAARLVARILRMDPVEALRAAGHADWAEFVEAQRSGAPITPRDRDLEFIAKLRTSSDPEMHKLADRFEADLERIRRVNLIEYEQLQRQRQPDGGEATATATATDNGVNKTA